MILIDSIFAVSCFLVAGNFFCVAKRNRDGWALSIALASWACGTYFYIATIGAAGA